MSQDFLAFVKLFMKIREKKSFTQHLFFCIFFQFSLLLQKHYQYAKKSSHPDIKVQPIVSNFISTNRLHAYFP